MEKNNDTETIIDSTENNDEGTVVETVEEKTEEKPQETPEAKIARLERQNSQLRKKLSGEKKDTSTKTKDDVSKVEQKTTDEFDYGEKAFLRSYNIKGADELALVKTWTKRTGDSLDAIVEDEIFQSKLKNLRDARASDEALPKSNRRGTAPAQNDESYWMSKIESGQNTLNDIEDVDMRRKVLNKRIEKEARGGKFSSNPIVMT